MSAVTTDGIPELSGDDGGVAAMIKKDAVDSDIMSFNVQCAEKNCVQTAQPQAVPKECLAPAVDHLISLMTIFYTPKIDSNKTKYNAQFYVKYVALTKPAVPENAHCNRPQLNRFETMGRLLHL
jgi:hypothetical protein